ncbi:MAG: hypothetical protein AAF688_10445 [Bacteroidota bacterium]
MKKILILIGLIIGMQLNSYGQDIELSDSKLKSILCQQWEIEYTMMNGMKLGQMPGAADFDLKFKNDGSYDIIREDEDNDSGIWTYKPQDKYVELSVKNKVTSRIKSINKNKLILILVSGKDDPPGLPNMEVHFKPI